MLSLSAQQAKNLDVSLRKSDQPHVQSFVYIHFYLFIFTITTNIMYDGQDTYLYYMNK